MRKLNAAGWKRAARVMVGLKGASINVKFLTKLQRQGVQIIQLPVSHRPRTKGSPTGANWRVIMRAFTELFRLRKHLLTRTPFDVGSALREEAPLPTPSATGSQPGSISRHGSGQADSAQAVSSAGSDYVLRTQRLIRGRRDGW